MLLAISVIILTWGMWIFLYYVPFYFLSYCVWGGIIIAGSGFIGILFPIQKIGLKTRKRSAGVMLTGMLVAILTLFWPPTITTSNRPSQRIDDFLPQYQCFEYHEEIAQVSYDKLQESLLTVSMEDMPVAVFLMRLRKLVEGELYEPKTTPMLEIRPGSMFLALDDSNPGEKVYGIVDNPSEEEGEDEEVPEVRTAKQFLAFNKPGHFKAAFNFRIKDKGDQGVLISTETRILGNDSSAQKLFARYWRVIYPGSSIIRRVWLEAIINKAKRSAVE